MGKRKPLQEAILIAGTNNKQIKIDNLVLIRAVGVLRALNHSLRQEIMQLLEQHGKLTVSDLFEKMKLEQSVTSQHLAILRRSGIVTTTRIGKFIYYSVNKDRVGEVADLVDSLAQK